MGALTQGAQPVEGGYAERGGKVAVRTAASRGLLHVHSDDLPDFPGKLKQAHRAFSAFHGRAVDAAGDLERTVGVKGLERGEFPFKCGGVGGSGNAQIDLGPGFGGDYVAPRAALDHTRVNSDP